MSTSLPSLAASGSRQERASSRSVGPSSFQPTTQARFGYLGHLSLREAQGNPDALRNVTALDGVAFMPHVMTMQRASTPWQYNTPHRRLEDPVIGQSMSQEGGGEKSSGMRASKSMTELSKSEPLPANYVRRIRRKAQQSLHNEAADHRSQIADLRHLADAASRSGNVYQALQAYHKMGIVFDNQGMYKEAVQKYKQFLALCITSKNTQGEALAYNCLGIDTFKLGQFDDSIQYHNKHLELADGTGRLIAHTNLGIVFQAMGLAEHAAIHHQHAIEYANRLGAKDAQCFTVGNLGIASAAQGDLQTSRICLQYHLSAAQRQKQLVGDNKFVQHTLKAVANNAHHRLGQVSANDGRMEDAASHFTEAMKVAKSKNDQHGEEKSSAMLGIARGLQGFDDYCKGLLEKRPGESATAFEADMGPA